MKDGYTALMWAALEGHPETVGTLIASGASVDAREKVGITNMKYRHSPSYPVDLASLLSVLSSLAHSFTHNLILLE